MSGASTPRSGASTPKSFDELIKSSAPSTSSAYSNGSMDLLVSAIVAGLPTFQYIVITRNLNISLDSPFVYSIPIAFLFSWLVVFWCYRRQTSKTFSRYAQELRDSRQLIPKSKETKIPSEESRKRVVFQQASAYSYSVTNIIFFTVWAFLHFRFLDASVQLPEDLKFAGTIILPSLAILSLTR